MTCAQNLSIFVKFKYKFFTIYQFVSNICDFLRRKISFER